MKIMDEMTVKDPVDQLSLAGDYFYGENGKSQDYAEAFKWYLRAAEQGDHDAEMSVAHCYEYGYGVARNYAESFKWVERSAQSGEAVKIYNLGVHYHKGIGVEKDLERVFALFREAANAGYVSAQFNLGLCYLYGMGVERNRNAAEKWLTLADRQGHPAQRTDLPS